MIVNYSSLQLGSWLSIVLTVTFFCWIFWYAWQRPIADSSVEDGPESEPYKAYTQEFDHVVFANDMRPKLMSMSLDMAKGHFELGKKAWERQIEKADIYKIEIENLPDYSNFSDPNNVLTDTAITILIDQSGSMKGEPMAWTAAGVATLTNHLSSSGAVVEVAGFTTAGWHGGFARQRWINNKRPKRPGRLCATLHIIYKSFEDKKMDVGSWQQMLDPNILRENIDGEAIECFESRLLGRTEQRKILMVLSDGAPVDDSTLMENGPSYLWRHVYQVIQRIQSEGKIELCAVGLNHNVDELYQTSAHAESASDLVVQGTKLVFGTRL